MVFATLPPIYSLSSSFCSVWLATLYFDSLFPIYCFKVIFYPTFKQIIQKQKPFRRKKKKKKQKEKKQWVWWVFAVRVRWFNGLSMLPITKRATTKTLSMHAWFDTLFKLFLFLFLMNYFLVCLYFRAVINWPKNEIEKRKKWNKVDTLEWNTRRKKSKEE